MNVKPLREVLSEVTALGIAIWVCKACALAREVDPDHLIPNAIKEMGDFIQALVESDKNVEY